MNSHEAPRPLNLGEILDRTVQLYRDRFLVYLGIAIIPTGVLLVFAGAIFLVLAWLGERTGAAATPINSARDMAIGFLVLAVISLPVLAVMLGVSSLSAAALNHAAAGMLAGKRPTIRGSYAEAWRRGWMYVGLYVLQALIVWVGPGVVWFFAVAFMAGITAVSSRGGSPQAAGALVGIVMIVVFTAMAGYAIFMTLCVSLAFPGCVAETINAGTAIKRSFRLSKGTRGRIFVLYLLGAVLGWIVSMVVLVIFVFVLALNPGLNRPQNEQMMGMAMIFLIYGSSFAVQSLTKPVYAIALMLFYYDQRIRKEGFDIEWMMERAGLVPDEATARSAESSVAPAGIETAPWRGASDAAYVQVATEATEQPAAVETTETADAAQPESGVQ